MQTASGKYYYWNQNQTKTISTSGQICEQRKIELCRQFLFDCDEQTDPSISDERSGDGCARNSQWSLRTGDVASEGGKGESRYQTAIKVIR